MSESAKEPTYVPAWSAGTRVRLTRKDHPEFLQSASIVAALPNPSQRQENQWYDVQFDDGRYGRFPARYLERLDSATEAKTA